MSVHSLPEPLLIVIGDVAPELPLQLGEVARGYPLFRDHGDEPRRRRLDAIADQPLAELVVVRGHLHFFSRMRNLASLFGLRP